MNAVAVSTLRFGVHATPASALGPNDEAFGVPRAGAKKIEEIDIFKSIRLADAKQDQKIAELASSLSPSS
jgi:hypothetical protein